MNTFTAPIAEEIWQQKYRLTHHDGEIVDKTVQDTWARIATALAQAEEPEKKAYWADRFYSLLEDFKYLPAGRITAGAGTGRDVTLFNCLAGSSPILTLEYGLVPIEQIVDQIVHILDGNGDWVQAPINSFDPQPTRTVTFTGGYNNRQTYSVDTTDNHRWILSDGSEVTTENLLTNSELKMVRGFNSPVQHAGYLL